MKIPFDGFIGGTYQSRSLNIDAQRCVNLYPEADKTGKHIISLIGTPGLELFANLGSDPIRGMHKIGSSLYIVAGNTLYSIVGGVISDLATIYSDNGRVSMADNGNAPTGGNQLAFVDNRDGYIYDIGTNELSTMEDGFPKGASIISFVNGFFVVDVPNSPGSFSVSGIYDGTSWNALDKSTADSSPDALMAVMPSHDECWLIGEETTEIWYPDGSNGHPPFSKVQGALIEHGTCAKWSVASGDSTLFWLGRNKNGSTYAVRANGYNVVIISNPAIESQWNKYPVYDAYGYCYTSSGHTFYVLTFPLGNATFVYDVSTGFWHERSSYVDDPFAIGRHIGNIYTYYNGMHLLGDYRNGNIYQMSDDFYTDNGDPIVAMRRSSHIYEKQGRIFYNSIEIAHESGIVDQDSNPVANIRWSDDGGHTWSNAHASEIGKVGQYANRVRWRKMGSSLDRVYEYTCAEPMRKVLVDAILDINTGEF